MRKAGIRVSTHNLTFAANTNGAHQVTLDGAVLEGPHSALFDDCTIEYRDRLHAEWTAEELSMRPHRVHARTTITTSQLRVEVMIAQLVINGQYVFDFIDFDVALLDDRFCPEGVWGRTACHQNVQQVDSSAYEVSRCKCRFFTGSC